jgi:hypothetical protein
METRRESSETNTNTTEPGSTVRIMESYIKEWMSGSREISEDNLRFLASCKNDEEFEHLLKKGHLSF